MRYESRPWTTEPEQMPPPRKAGGRVRAAAQPRREATTPAADRLKAIGLMCLAVALFSALDTSAKYLVTQAHLPVVQIVWSRFLGQFLIMLSMLSVLPLSALLRTRKLKLELLRSFLMVSTTACNFLALRHLRLDQTISVVFLAPLIVALLAGPFLGEWVGWRRLRRHLHRLHRRAHRRASRHRRPAPGVRSSPSASMLAYAFFMLLTRYLAAYDAPLVMLFYSMLLGTFALAPFAIWQWVWPQTLGRVAAARYARRARRHRALPVHPRLPPGAGVDAWRRSSTCSS